MNKRLLQLILSTVPAALPAAAMAAALGEISYQSQIGAPFRAEIRLFGDTSDVGDCLRLKRKRGSDSGIQTILQGELSFKPHLLVVSSPELGEMVASFTIENICSGLSREYTLLLSPPEIVPRNAQRPRRAVASSASNTSKPPLAPSSPGYVTWIAAEGESLSDMAVALFPHDAAARDRFVTDAVANNPELFDSRADTVKPMTAGTALKVPAPGTKHHAKNPVRAPTRTQTPPQAETTTPKKQTTLAEEAPNPPITHPLLKKQAQDRLVIESGRDENAAPNAQNKTSDNARSADADFEARERRLLESLNNVVTAQLQIAERLAQLEAAQAHLIEELNKVKVDSQQQAMNALKAPSPEPAPTGLGNWLQLLLFISGGVVVAAAMMLLRRARQQDEIEIPYQPFPYPQEVPASTPHGNAREPHLEPTVLDEPEASPETRAPGLAQIDTTPKPNTTAEDRDNNIVIPTIDEPETEEHDSAIELAEIMLSFGRVQGAAETLADFIRANPKQAISPWLKLLSVYRMADMQSEFDALSRQLNKTFNVKIVSWDEFEATLHATDESLEQMPHIVGNLTRLWPTQECQTYLDTLLRDNREGTRQGFPFPVVDELLMLSGVLNLLLGPGRNTDP